MSRFAIGQSHFLLDGQPFRIISGSIHYFRVHPAQWRDRIRKAKQMGLNTIDTYIAWNAHSSVPGVFDTSDGLDFGSFLDAIAAEGMHAIVRPGPYICAEWDGGGLPAWLFQNPSVGIRRFEPSYMKAVRAYYEAIGPILAPRQVDQGGPVLLVQVENEYGAYGHDVNYLRALAELTREVGITVPLTTVDQPEDAMLANGGLPDLHRTASFGSRSAERLAALRRHQPTGPLMCSEYWNGWFDCWGQRHHTTSAADSAADLDALLSTGASVNLYMFCGGTNFGFTNGAGDKGSYTAITTSYDYDAPLDETGTPTAKYWAFREVIAKHAPVSADRPPATRPDAPSFTVHLDRQVPMWDVINLLAKDTHSFNHLPTADEIGHYSGFTLYRHRTPAGPGVLDFREVRDRALAFLNGLPIGTLNRDHHEHRIAVPEEGDLQLLVENMGRVDYGPRIGEPTGLIGPSHLGSEELCAWDATPLIFDNLAQITEQTTGEQNGFVVGPAFAVAQFDTPHPSVDHFLDLSDCGKGLAWVNGFNLGRYWSRGPQQTLYVPAPVLRAKDNTIIVFELHACPTQIAFSAQPDLGPREA
jgi:beta-galactosidase